jgi:hypothetical protein
MDKNIYVHAGEEVMLTFDAAVEWFGGDFLRLMSPTLKVLPVPGSDTDDPRSIAYGAKGMVKVLREGPWWERTTDG